MRIKREKQDLCAACLDHRAHFGFGRRVAVAHAEINHDIVAIARLHAFCDLAVCCFGDRHQRAFVRFFVPDRLVGRARCKRAFRQDDQAATTAARAMGVVDDAAVRQKFTQVAAHGPIVVIVGRPEVAQQNSDLGCFDLGVVRLCVRRAGGVLWRPT